MVRKHAVGISKGCMWSEEEQPMKVQTFTAVIHQEGNLYVASCPELGTVSQGAPIEDALSNLKEAT